MDGTDKTCLHCYVYTHLCGLDGGGVCTRIHIKTSDTPLLYQTPDVPTHRAKYVTIFYIAAREKVSFRLNVIMVLAIF